VIDLGNQLVYKEYQKMGNETNVYKGEIISKNLVNGGIKNEVTDEQNYVTCLQKFNQE